MTTLAEAGRELKRARQDYMLAVRILHDNSRAVPNVLGFPERSIELGYAVKAEWQALAAWQAAHEKHQKIYQEAVRGKPAERVLPPVDSPPRTHRAKHAQGIDAPAGPAGPGGGDHGREGLGGGSPDPGPGEHPREDRSGTGVETWIDYATDLML